MKKRKKENIRFNQRERKDETKNNGKKTKKIEKTKNRNQERINPHFLYKKKKIDIHLTIFSFSSEKKLNILNSFFLQFQSNFNILLL